MSPRRTKSGFTLIELSIVLVIIGLMVGGVLVGQDLIRAASERAQITQIEQFNQAVNTFRGKYGYLPGDIKDPDASSFGFAARGSLEGQGDGNGVLETFSGGNAPLGSCSSGGEITMFWVDLSKAGLIPNTFNTATSTSAPLATNATTPSIIAFLPPGKLGLGTYVSIWSYEGSNYYELTQPIQIDSGGMQASGIIPVRSAYNIDRKVDDGLPQTGTITARATLYVTSTLPFNWSGEGYYGASNHAGGAYPGVSAAPDSDSCYDNGNNGSDPMIYSLTQNNGANGNCALSFSFQ